MNLNSVNQKINTNNINMIIIRILVHILIKKQRIVLHPSLFNTLMKTIIDINNFYKNYSLINQNA